MTKFKLDFLKSSATSSSTRSLPDNISEPSTASPKSKRFFTLRRKRNSCQSQPPFDVGQGNRSASPPKAIHPVADAEVAAALPIVSSISISSSKQFAESLDQLPPAHKMTDRPETIEAPDSSEKYNQIFKESDGLDRTETFMEITKTRESGLTTNQRDTLSYSHSLDPFSNASKTAGSHIARQDHGQNIQIQFTDQHYEVSKFYHVLEALQRAARRVEADQSISQRDIFRSLAPLAIFLYLLGIGVLLPRQQRYRCSQTPEEDTSVAKMILLFFIGMALALAFLRGMVWIVSVLGRVFCEADLTQIVRKGECVDVDGRGKGEAELIWGGMFMWWPNLRVETFEVQ